MASGRTPRPWVTVAPSGLLQAYDSAAPALQSRGNMTGLRLWLCCTSNSCQNRAIAIVILNTVRTQYVQKSISKPDAGSSEPKLSARVARRLGAQPCWSQTTLCLAVGAFRAGLGKKTPRRCRWTSKEHQRRIVSPKTRFDRSFNAVVGPRAATHLGHCRSAARANSSHSS